MENEQGEVERGGGEGAQPSRGRRRSSKRERWEQPGKKPLALDIRGPREAMVGIGIDVVSVIPRK